jgi:hypothetical protein
MKRVTRRTALAALSVSGVAALIPVTQGADPEAVTTKHELFVVGPFSLGEWFKKHREQKKRKGAIVVGAPDDDEIIKSLNECKLYVIDQRVWKDKDTVRFGDSKDGYPKLVAEGKLMHTWKEKGKNCTIWLTVMTLAGSSTEERTPPPCRMVTWNVSIDIRGENALVVETASHAFMSDRPTSYDITGKQLPDEK